MQVIENWSNVEGEVVESAETSDVDGHGVLAVRVLEVRPVPDYPSLLDGREGEVVRVLIPQQERVAPLPAAGERVGLRVRAASPGRYFGLVREPTSVADRETVEDCD